MIRLRAISLGILLASGAAPAAPGLVAEVYPGAVPLHVPQGQGAHLASVSWDSSRAHVFLCKDDAAKVAAFYSKKIANATSAPEKGEYSFVAQEWTAGEYGKETAGVRVVGNSAARRGSEIGGFVEMRSLAYQGNHTRQEVDRELAKHEHLNRAWFNLTDEKDRSGGFADEQRKLHTEYAARAKAPLNRQNASMEETNRKMMELIQQGRMNEASALARQTANGAQKASQNDAWLLWLEYFEKLEQKAYPTILIIDAAPARR